jgi:electron transfer flavoprotein alpha subunit
VDEMQRFTMIVFPESNVDRAIRAAAALAPSLGGAALDVVAPGRTAAPAGVTVLSRPVGDPLPPAALVRDVADHLRAAGPGVVLVYGDSAGSAVAPALAWELGAGLLTDCLAVTGDPGALRFTRRRATTHLLDDYELPPGWAVVTVAPEIRSAGTAIPDVTAVPGDGEPGTSPHRSSSYDRWLVGRPVGPPAIAEADLLVGIGRGCTGLTPGSYEAVADLLGAQIAATRQAIEWKIAAADRKLGDTGLKVAPRTYLALGLSGANQHMSGIWGGCSVIAVNRNPYAAVHDVADIAVVADAGEFLTALRKELEGRLGIETSHDHTAVN